ncbi:hypothetical protein AB0H82_09905 [Streptomyces sp. NPDC050732]
MVETIAAGRWYPDGAGGLAIFIIAITVLVAMVLYGRSKKKR